MTTREIAETAGVSVDTATRKIKEMYPDRVKNGKTTRLIQSEALCVMAELRKKNFVEPLQNAEVPTQNTEVAQLGAMVANLAIMMQESMKMMMSQQNQITAILASKPTEQIQLPAPKLAPRDELRMIVNKASKTSGDYSGAWKTLYTEIYYRLHINATERAKNANTTAIDILDAEGLLEDAILIAREIFK